jgi:hypothetical protein
MQSLNSPLTNPATTTHLELMTVLADIARNVEIGDNFAIHHPDYQSLEIQKRQQGFSKCQSK